MLYKNRIMKLNTLIQLAIGFILFAAPLGAKEGLKPLSAEEAKRATQEIENATKGLKSLSCTFTQEKRLKLMQKSLISKGTLLYQAPSFLRWEYKEPYSYTFEIKENIVTTIYKNKVTRIDATKNSLFREIVKVMLESVTGECISGSGSFSSTLFTNVNGEITAHLIPTRRELKQVFREIYITFDKMEHLPLEVVMMEEGGDTTTITLKKN